MRAYMPTKGELGLDMMLRTCTIQVNLDYADEADVPVALRELVDRLRVVLGQGALHAQEGEGGELVLRQPSARYAALRRGAAGHPRESEEGGESRQEDGETGAPPAVGSASVGLDRGARRLRTVGHGLGAAAARAGAGCEAGRGPYHGIRSIATDPELPEELVKAAAVVRRSSDLD